MSEEGFVVIEAPVGDGGQVYARLSLSELAGQQWAQGLLDAISQPVVCLSVDRMPTKAEVNEWRKLWSGEPTEA